MFRIQKPGRRGAVKAKEGPEQQAGGPSPDIKEGKGFLGSFRVLPDARREDKAQARIYIAPKYKMAISALFAVAWLGTSVYVALPWMRDLSVHFPAYLAWALITGLALVPGMANAFVVSGLLMDRRPIFKAPAASTYPAVSVLIAAYNEEGSIASTLQSVLNQDYPSGLEVIVIDDGSKDRTAQIVSQVMSRNEDPAIRIKLKSLPQNRGKANALNAGLKLASHDYIVTLDADSYLHANSLFNLVTHMIYSPVDTGAVAGCVLVRNSRANLLTKLQEWDYFHGISVVKRIQSLYQGTLVAQGAYSIFRRSVFRELGGWSDTMGEDIVLTWGMHSRRFRVGFAENAIVFTNVPETYGKFFKQRRRWARGLVEAFIQHPEVIMKPRLNVPFIWYNLTFPFLDFIYLFGFVPGLIAAAVFRNYLIVGLMTFFLLPLAVLINGIMYSRQKQVFRRVGLKVRQNFVGFFVYMLPADNDPGLAGRVCGGTA
jgi:biofilm PGA synthesis N-glycosyltransferase PgaC